MPINGRTDKENVVIFCPYSHTGVLHSHKEEGNYIVHGKMDGNGNHHVKCNKSFSERPVLHVFSH
jgi:hypothetical protein